MAHKKQIFKISILKSLLGEENSCVYLVPTTRILALPPFFLNDMKSGILYLLSNMLKKYDRTLEGIVIGYQNIKILMDENTGIIPMGGSETEVNISVEFYIFQPKIGNLLQGVINKKSSSHIGCLVHRYFNASILKPEDVDFDDWICKDFNVDDKIIFKVKDLDFTVMPPFIEGAVDDEGCMGRVKCDFKKTVGVSNDFVNNVSEKCSNEVVAAEKEAENLNSKQYTASNLSKELDVNDKHSKKKKKKDKKKEENGKHTQESSKVVTSSSSKTLEKSEPTESEDLNSFNFSKLDKSIEERKSKVQKFSLELSKTEQVEGLNSKEYTSSSFSKELDVNDKHSKKKKKKDKKRDENGKHASESSKIVTSSSSKTSEKSEPTEPKSLHSFSFSELDKIIEERKRVVQNLKAESSKIEQAESLNSTEFTSGSFSKELDVNDRHSKKKKKKDKKKEENEKHIQESSKPIKTLEKSVPVQCQDLSNFLKLDKIVEDKKTEAQEPHLESSKVQQQVESLNSKEFTSSTFSKELNVNDKHSKKKKKKDKKKEENGKHAHESSKSVTSNSYKTSEKSEPSQCQDLNNFLKLNKIEEKKKTEAQEPHPELNKTEQCTSSNEAEDDVFYSTQLDFHPAKKMRISSCSPITKNTSFEEQKKDLKRKAESDKSQTGSKKPKISHSGSSDKEKTNPDDVDSMRQEVTDGREKSKKRKKEAGSLLEELRKREIQRVMDELNISDREEKKTKKKKKERNSLGDSSKKSTKTGMNGTISVENMTESLLKEELNRIKDKPVEKKGKKRENKDGGVESLFEKLLTEAKTAVDVQPDKNLTFPMTKKSKKKKKKDCPDETPKKVINGSMYDVAFSPAKINFEKSLFSDSEQSNESSTTKEKKVRHHPTVSSDINSQKERENLYERLLGEAKSSIESSSKKKR